MARFVPYADDRNEGEGLVVSCRDSGSGTSAAPDVWAYARGGEVLVVVPVRDVELADPGSGWREVVPGLYER